MQRINTERDFQSYILRQLEKGAGYRIRNAKEHYNRVFAMDVDMLFEFLEATQPQELEKLTKIHKHETRQVITASIDRFVTNKPGSLISALKNGIDISGVHLRLMYARPASTLNPELSQKYDANIFSVMEEVEASDNERIDIVIFCNGLAIAAIELKTQFSGQNYTHAISQYKTDRSNETCLFHQRGGTLVNFAMDTTEVHMTTRLAGDATHFLPFNQGNGEGTEAGAGNPLPEEGKFSVAYMWEDILTKDTLIDLISNFIYIDRHEETNEKTGKKTVKEHQIFPRYHQLDAVRKIVSDVREHGTERNYLIQHSAGSGKTKTISWLAHRLASTHDDTDTVVYTNVVIVTDRVVVDRQLQDAIRALDYKEGLIKVMDDKCTSADLRKALESNTKIIATTIQKFPHILGEIKDLAHKRFAVIIDEAHSSTSGKNMAAVTSALGGGASKVKQARKQAREIIANNTDGQTVLAMLDRLEITQEGEYIDLETGETYIDPTDYVLTEHMRGQGKQSNVSIFAFTATPKPTTLELFGHKNTHGQAAAFHLYSMKQAIEEGFILDVLANYTTYQTYFELNKTIESDPRCNTLAAQRQIARFVELHDTNIAQRIEIIVEHFRLNVLGSLGGKEKAMVVTASREAAVKYKQEFEKYIARKGYTNLHALVAFSGKVNIDGTEYTEVGMNGFREEQLPAHFDSDEYQVLLVANKYQTGFDQPKLCAMYVAKKLAGVNAVQTLSRLNRAYGENKRVFVLDFVNTYEEMQEAFAPFYTTTLLSNTVTPEGIYDLMVEIDGYSILDQDDVEKVARLLEVENAGRGNAKIVRAVERCVRYIEHFDDTERLEVIQKLRSFVRYYEFLLQATTFEDVAIHKKYLFITLVLAYVKNNRIKPTLLLEGKIEARDFRQDKQSENKGKNLKSKPVVKLPSVESVLPPDKEKLLSEIIAEINSRHGIEGDNAAQAAIILQLFELMKSQGGLVASAQNNTEEDFAFTYYDKVDDVLVDGLENGQEFLGALLNDEESKRRIFDFLMPDIYRYLRGE